MRQREIERFVKQIRIYICRYTNNDMFMEDGYVSDLIEPPKECDDFNLGVCLKDGRKCDAVKFRLVREAE